MLDKFAEELREAREKSNISLQQMAAKTRIDIKFLEAIDNGNFGFLPELYVKAFIKQFAKVVGLDEQEVIDKFDAARDGKLYEKVTEEKPDEDSLPKKSSLEKSEKPPQPPKAVQTYTDAGTSKPDQSPDVKSKKGLASTLGIIGVIIICALVYLLFFDKSSEIVVEEKPYEDVLQQTTQRYQEEEAIAEVEAEVLPDSLILQVSNIDSSDSAWVLVIYDDNLKEDFLLFPNTVKTVKASQVFKVTLGNSGVIRLALNGSPVDFEGRKGSVRHFKIDRAGLERLYSPPVLTQD